MPSPALVLKQVAAELQRREITEFQLVVETARIYLDSLTGRELAEVIAQMTVEQYRAFDNRFAEQPRNNFASCARTAISLWVAVHCLENNH
jgi:hypothetical protein